MQYKSFLVENNLDILTKNLNLFYGENNGLINEFKSLIKNKNNKNKIIIFDQDEILKNNVEFKAELSNFSLFNETKVYFVNQVNDNLLETIEEILPLLEDQKIYLFSGLLDKKSKIRSYFENSSECGIVACYEDNEITLKRIINTQLKGYEGLSPQVINTIIDNSKMDRSRLKNEIEKIRLFFHGKKIEINQLETLLNLKFTDNFNNLKDMALLGNKIKTNELLSETILEKEKTLYYLNLINQRFSRLNELKNFENSKLEDKINNLKPPIFWKDKANFISQAKIWNSEKIKEIQKKTYDVEIKVKSNSTIDKNILIKKLLIDVCELANA